MARGGLDHRLGPCESQPNLTTRSPRTEAVLAAAARVPSNRRHTAVHLFNDQPSSLAHQCSQYSPRFLSSPSPWLLAHATGLFSHLTASAAKWRT